MRVCLGAVIYKQAEAFLMDLVGSINGQTDQDFDLLIVNDNYELKDLQSLGVVTEEAQLSPSLAPAVRGERNFLNLKPVGCTVAQTRIEMIRHAKELGYDLLIVCDADDTFASTRVARYKQAYEMDKTYAFYYNELVTDKGDTILEDLPEEVTDVRAISQSNFIGMGTTAINLNMLDDSFITSLSEGDCQVFDWYFYTRVLMDVGSGALVTGAATTYRIHAANTVGTSHDVEQEYQVKLTHYKNLGIRYPYFQRLYEALQQLDIDSIDTSQHHNGYWWSNIIMEDSYEI